MRPASSSPASGACRALACFLEGVGGATSSATRDEATRRLEEGARHAAVRAPHVHALCLAQLAVLALERADWDEVTELSARARAQVDRHGLRDAPTSALVFAVSAVARAHRGRIEEAQRDLQQATQLLDGADRLRRLVRRRGAHPPGPRGAPAQRRVRSRAHT